MSYFNTHVVVSTVRPLGLPFATSSRAEDLRENCAVPEGTRIFFSSSTQRSPTTRWAKLFRPLRGSILRNPFSVPAQNEFSHTPCQFA